MRKIVWLVWLLLVIYFTWFALGFYDQGLSLSSGYHVNRYRAFGSFFIINAILAVALAYSLDLSDEPEKAGYQGTVNRLTGDVELTAKYTSERGSVLGTIFTLLCVSQATLALRLIELPLPFGIAAPFSGALANWLTGS